MSDSTLFAFLGELSAAALAAYTPAPPTPASGPDPLYLIRNTDDSSLNYWDGANWQVLISAGTVTNTGTLTDHALMVGNGGVDISAVGSLGTSTTVLHGAAAGDPTWGAVALATDVSGDLPFANLAQGSALSVLGVTGNATADNASIAAGTDHQVLRRSGTAVAFGAVNLAQGAAITGVLPGLSGGGLVLLEQHTASTSATLDFTTWYSSTYDDYVVRLLDVIPATDDADLWFRVSTDGGATYVAGADYYNAITYGPNTGASGTIQGNAASKHIIFPAIDNGTANGGVSGKMDIYHPASTASRKAMTWQVAASQGAAFYVGNGAGTWNATTAVNACRFMFSTGDIASGVVRIYGVAK